MLGGVFENKQRFSRSEYQQIETTTEDTVSMLDNAFEMPMMYGAGLSYTYDGRLVISCDYQCQDWSKTKYFNEENVLKVRQRWAAGVQWKYSFPLQRSITDW